MAELRQKEEPSAAGDACAPGAPVAGAQASPAADGPQTAYVSEGISD